MTSMNGQKARTIAGIGGVAPGDHLCFAFDERSQFVGVTSRYILDGLAASQRVACFFDDDLAGGTIRALETRIPDLAGGVRRGALVLGSFNEAYLPEGKFDPDARVMAYEAMARAALSDGFAGLRVMGEATRVLNDRAVRERWPGYELRADLLASELQVVALCAYDRTRSDAEGLRMLRSVHGGSIGGWDPSPHFFLHAAPGASLVVAGEVDFTSADTVAGAMTQAASRVSTPSIDLSGLRFVDVAGMRSLIAGIRALSRHHPRVVITGASPTFRRVWSLLGCDVRVETELEFA